MRSLKRKLIKFSGYSLALVLPKKAVHLFGWQQSDTVHVTVDSARKRLLITKATASENVFRQKPALSDDGDVRPIPPMSE